jgi:hypothetical protein
VQVHRHFVARRGDDGAVLDDTRTMHNGKQKPPQDHARLARATRLE